jgi:GLPGLI family protein
MKNFNYILAILLLSLFFNESLYAQNFSGIATYKTSSQLKIELDSTAMSPAQMKAIQDKLQKQLQKEYTLAFTTSESVWKQVESLNSGPASVSSNGMEVMVADGSGNSVLYKNIAKKQFEEGSDLMGKRFIVKGELTEYEWKLTGETKKIGNYNCQKAVNSRIVDAKKFSTGMKEMEVTKDTIVTTAWFTTDIPVSNGPEKYYGLPGLILEVQRGNRTIICTKIELNPSEKIKIEKPKKGKVVTPEEYVEISEKKMEEMMKRYSGGNDGEQIEIRIGG